VETTQTKSGDDRPRRLRNGIGVGAVLAVGLAAGFIAWLVLDRTDDEASSVAGPIAATSTVTTPAASEARPAIASVAQLQKAATSSAVPIYWVGTRQGTRIELTRAPGGSVIVRYLPPSARAGASGSFLTVATYSRPNGYREVLHASTEAKARTIKLAGGGIAVYSSDEPANLHLGYPGQPYQIEVFAPEADLARKLVAGGLVRPAG
jgi:hypothetical protein